MLAATVLLMMVVVVALVMASLMLTGRPAAHARPAGSRSNGDSGWLPAVFSGDGSSGCSAGDAGCDGGGGGGGD